MASELNITKRDPALPLDIIAPFGCGIQTGAGAVLNVPRPYRALATGPLPLDRIMTHYDFDQIEQAVRDAEDEARD